MTMLSEDDQNLRDMSREELDAAWDLWFDLAQTTNDDDPPYTHGVFADREVTPDRVRRDRRRSNTNPLPGHAS